MKKVLLVLAVALPVSLIVLSVAGPVNHSSASLSQPAVTTVADGGTPLPSPIPPGKSFRSTTTSRAA